MAQDRKSMAITYWLSVYYLLATSTDDADNGPNLIDTDLLTLKQLCLGPNLSFHHPNNLLTEVQSLSPFNPIEISLNR